MNHEEVRAKFKSNPRLKRMVDWLIMNQVETRPRWFISISIGAGMPLSIIL